MRHKQRNRDMNIFEELLDCLGADDWEGDDCSITCPCGHRIEADCPKCPDGCVNPIMKAGMI